jgi:GNAT superfamily N-acetyltransferase
MPERGPDGLLKPYTEQEVRDILAGHYTAVFAAQVAPYEATTGDLTIRAVAHAGYSYSLGPAIEIAVWADDLLVGGAGVERDIDFEDEAEDWGPAWVAQSLFVHPDHQRRGIGTLMLRTLRSLTGIRIAEDTQMTRASTDLWDKLRGELWAEPGPQDATDDPAILAFRATANELVAAAKARYQASNPPDEE